MRLLWRLCFHLANESAIAELARRRHGVVTAAQLYAAGFSRPTVAKRVRANRLHRIHRGVYAVDIAR